jgi:hypothetical protein
MKSSGDLINIISGLILINALGPQCSSIYLDHRYHFRKLQLLVFYEGYTNEEAEWITYKETDKSWDDEQDRELARA